MLPLTARDTTSGWRREKGPAFDEFHKLMASPVMKIKAMPVAVLLDDSLTWCEENCAKRTFERYRDFIQAFAGTHGMLKMQELHAGHVTTWLTEKKSWNSTTKRNATTALQRAFNAFMQKAARRGE
jgi:hypothetical protein